MEFKNVSKSEKGTITTSIYSGRPEYTEEKRRADLRAGEALAKKFFDREGKYYILKTRVLDKVKGKWVLGMSKEVAPPRWKYPKIFPAYDNSEKSITLSLMAGYNLTGYMFMIMYRKNGWPK